jgi:hypothetical protein
MRTIFAAAMLAAMPLTAAVADTPVTMPELAGGEVLLEVNGLGVVRSPATLAMLTLTARGEGSTLDEASRARDAEVQRIIAAARAAGAATGDIRVTEGGAGDLVEDLRTFDVAEPPPPEAGASEAAEVRTRTNYAASTVTIQLRNVDRAQELQRTFGGSSQTYGIVRSPVYSLVDDSAARRSARAEAITAARADAESYAAALGMRISRVLRVTERGGLDFLSMMVSESEAARQMQWFPVGQAEPQVTTYAVVGVDYAMVPR